MPNGVKVAELGQYLVALSDVGVKSLVPRYPREGHSMRKTRHVADFWTGRDMAGIWRRR